MLVHVIQSIAFALPFRKSVVDIFIVIIRTNTPQTIITVAEAFFVPPGLSIARHNRKNQVTPLLPPVILLGHRILHYNLSTSFRTSSRCRPMPICTIADRQWNANLYLHTAQTPHNNKSAVPVTRDRVENSKPSLHR